ncbi:MAG: PhoX family phosphatase [Rhodocyclaceae bacterium]
MAEQPIRKERPAADLPQRQPTGTTRRRLLQAGLGGVALSLFGLPAFAAAANRPRIGFSPIAVSLADLVRLPEGYVAQVLYAWGDPVSSAAAFRADAGNSASEQAEQAGMHHDGMHFFPFVDGGKPSSTHGLMCINHEYTDDGLLHPGGMAEWTHPKTMKSQSAHGISLIEVERRGNRWHVVRPSSYARRITARTPVRIGGPAAGAPAMRTKDDRRGHIVFGTLANCAMGVTPWGTYLSCEENFSGYFNGVAMPSAAQNRYGIRENGAGYRWHEHDSRFDVATEPNEANRFGWVVEIDPWNPGRAPVKRTALGRFKHEGATVTLGKDGHVVVYLGDDERFEYIYKFVSRDRHDAGNPSAAGSLLDAGTLHVARFGEDGQGEWLALEHGQNGLTVDNGFIDQADVLIRARQAADQVGATRMDRPESIAIDPASGEVYCALTNNTERGKGDAPGGDAANPRSDNAFGHIIRWREAGGDAASQSFAWDIFALCGDPQHDNAGKRGNIKGDAFGSPDGLSFDTAGRLWIQTDVATGAMQHGDYARLGNNQMLVADVASGEIRRFMTGPKGCEITGFTMTPDARQLFVNIQHPGETASARSDPANPTQISGWPASQFPDLTGGRPRSATIVVLRQDGGVIGD